eukprot:CAMPEP_0185597132 /NCGR_PEP_ID=MMETSP0434-20130131/81171_1 /TAXON_ID=626734 ORGANISM="Favella taraikaensis, Strain Fe Narragansett Bay" /NCGR_SAMPLE_ID=MMETSP0434 /ASSEMBLY_ACC=CAM_ASM_000379 /LENGTH=77 /DNA_ID=CAMNT_0028225771 /DNA_START=1064 /DNA_END=1297 /DNA_ORIENTATION=+
MAINKKMDSISQYLQEPSLVLQVASMPEFKIKQEQIIRLRAQHRRTIAAEMHKFKSRQNERFIDYDFALSGAGEQQV